MGGIEDPAGAGRLARACVALLLPLALLALLGTGEPAAASEGDAPLASPNLLGDLGGARTRLERLGIRLRLFYNQYLSVKPAGGGADDDAVFGHSGSFDFLTQVDLEALSGWRGAELLLHVKGQYERSLNAEVGALSAPIDDADFDEPIYVDELWFQQSAWDGRLRLRLGYAEQQTVFDRNAFANSEDRQFLTTFLDNNPLVPLPNGLAVALIAAPTAWLELAAGAADADNRPRLADFDTAFDDLTSLSGYLEALIRSPWSDRDHPGAYRAGVFLDSRELLDLQRGRVSRSHVGAYLSCDQVVLRYGARDRGALGLFARAGYADPDANLLEWFWSAGLEAAGPIPGRDADVLGLGVYQAIGSPASRNLLLPRLRHETGIELYYAALALGWLVVTPDFQYIVDPGATGAADDAFVATLRLRVTL